MNFINKASNKLFILSRAIKLGSLINNHLKNTKENNSSGQYILLLNLKFDLFYTITNYYLSYFFIKKGYHVIILSDDHLMSHYDNSQSIEVLTRPNLKYFYTRFLYNLLKKFILKLTGLTDRPQVKHLFLSSFKIKFQRQSNFLHEITSNMETSHRRFFLGQSFDPHNLKHQKFAQINKMNERNLQIALDGLFKTYFIKLAVILDGIGITGGTVLDFCKSKNINFCTYLPTEWKDRSIIISRNPFSIENNSRHWNTYKKEIFAKKHNNQCHLIAGEDFLKNRVNYMQKSLNKDEIETWEKIEYVKSKNHCQKTIIAFPNISWDGVLRKRNTIFNSVEDWLNETYNFCLKNNFLFILKEHPKGEFLNYRSYFSILKNHSDLFSNTSLLIHINEKQKVNPIRLSRKFSNVNTVYSGTLISELAFAEQPVIISGNSPYSNKNIGLEPHNKEEYFNLLKYTDLRSSFNLKEKLKFKRNSILAASYQFSKNIQPMPTMPLIKDFRDPQKYWKNIDFHLIENSLNHPQLLSKTVERFLFEIQD